MPRRTPTDVQLTSLTQLRAFVLVAELESFTKAAQQLAVTQPAISILVSKLESDLEVTLIRRRGAFALTEAGKQLLPHARQTVIAAARAVDTVKRLPRQP